jgi:hypothetical protein
VSLRKATVQGKIKPQSMETKGRRAGRMRKEILGAAINCLRPDDTTTTTTTTTTLTAIQINAQNNACTQEGDRRCEVDQK